MQDNRGTIWIGERQIYGNQCIHKILGQKIDIIWNSKTAKMTLSSTNYHQFHYISSQYEQIFRCVTFKHGSHCPLLDSNIQKNHQKPMRPCAVVLIQNENDKCFLATQRPSNISFGGKWVLPGGHLEVQESIVEGGIRQCMEQVGFKKQYIRGVRIEESMGWQSVYVSSSQVKATGIVLFYKIRADKFQVFPQMGEIDKYEWRSSTEGEPWGGGWAEGHLNYLRYAYFHSK